MLSANSTSLPIANAIRPIAARLARNYNHTISYFCMIMRHTFIYEKSMTLEFNLFKSGFCDQISDTSVIFWEKKKRQCSKIPSLSIQILQYEFLGPIPLDEWGPPMEKLVFLILSRDKDKFNIVYVGDCEKTDDKSFFVQHSLVSNVGSNNQDLKNHCILQYCQCLNQVMIIEKM